MNNNKMRNIRSGGFTLIELLVVIAIIGVLSAIVIAALTNARGRGNDAAMQSDMRNLRSQSAIVFSSNGCYNDGGTNCTFSALTKGSCATALTNTGYIFNESKIATIVNNILNNDLPGNFSSCVENANGSAWAISVQKSDHASTYCIDSTGNSKTTTGVANTQGGINSTVNPPNLGANCI